MCALIGQGAPANAVSEQAAAINEMFTQAEAAMGHRTADASAAFFGSLTILLR